jgi:hypothetical protein
MELEDNEEDPQHDEDESLMHGEKDKKLEVVAGFDV